MMNCVMCGINTNSAFCLPCNENIQQKLEEAKGHKETSKQSYIKKNLSNLGRDDIKALIKKHDCIVRDSDYLSSKDFTSWFYGIQKGALGMYVSNVCHSSVFIFTGHPNIEENINNTLLHEFGHYISYELSLGHNKDIKAGKIYYSDYDPLVIEQLSMEEEYRADTFAARLSDLFNLPIPEHVQERFKHYDDKLRHRKAELGLDVNQMMKFVGK